MAESRTREARAADSALLKRGGKESVAALCSEAAAACKRWMMLWVKNVVDGRRPCQLGTARG